ncbi:hypothetical protein H0H87_007841, partial [Tephrocybe sp. NHM501043]
MQIFACDAEKVKPPYQMWSFAPVPPHRGKTLVQESKRSALTVVGQEMGRRQMRESVRNHTMGKASTTQNKTEEMDGTTSLLRHANEPTQTADKTVEAATSGEADEAEAFVKPVETRTSIEAVDLEVGTTPQAGRDSEAVGGGRAVGAVTP